MSALLPRTRVEITAGTAHSLPAKRLLVVVGYDGSPSARCALDQAEALLRNREGALEVVYVAPMLLSACVPPEALAELTQAFDGQESALAAEVHGRLRQQAHAWHFQRRDGTVSTELRAVAADLNRQYGESAEIVILPCPISRSGVAANILLQPVSGVCSNSTSPAGSTPPRLSCREWCTSIRSTTEYTEASRSDVLPSPLPRSIEKKMWPELALSRHHAASNVRP
jgi:nucleotide-binding universal stress UspA family protein